MEELKNRGHFIKPNEKLDPELVKHIIEIENIQNKIDSEMKSRVWRSCCFRIDEKASYFFGKLLISFSIISISAYQLITHTENCVVSVAYGGFLSTILGFWLGKIS